jgi:ABC-type Fe3+/spermidine/putrescine transport system ATPase subunit
MIGGAVELENVSRHFGLQQAVTDLSLSISPGEFFTILGPSGSGKSTTLAMIAGFQFPDSGRVLLGGRDMTRTEPRARGLGMVFQNYAIFPHLDVFENVAFPLRAKRTPKAEVAARVAEALATVRLSGFERRYASQLSGGQQQRVAFARAIVAHPPIVLMDEPLGALDKNLRYHMQTEIGDIQRRLGMTVVFVTHDQEEAMNLSDRIAIMDGGRLMQVGAPREVYERPANPMVARFLGESNLLSGRATGNRLHLEDGQVLRAANAMAGKALLFVRPEKLTLQESLANPEEGQNSLTGQVIRSAFLGNLVRTELAIGQTLKLVIDATNGAGSRPLGVGTIATACWPISDSLLLGAD